jgi:hypothetical protein
VLLFSRLATPDGVASHIVDELVMSAIQPALVALEKERDGVPVRLAVSMMEVSNPMMPTFRC